MGEGVLIEYSNTLLRSASVIGVPEVIFENDLVKSKKFRPSIKFKFSLERETILLLFLP